MTKGFLTNKVSYAVVLFSAALFLVGLAFIPLQRVRLNPEENGNSIYINLFWTGATPEIIESQLTSQTEAALGVVRGIKQIESWSYNQSATIKLSISKDLDINAMRYEISTIIRQLYPKYPQGVSFPVINMSHTDNGTRSDPLLTFSLNGNMPAEIIRSEADDRIKKKLSNIDGVNFIEISGNTPFEYKIEYDYEVLHKYGLTELTIISAIERYLQRFPLGHFISGNMRFSVVMNNPQKDSIDFNRIILANIGGKIISLSDVASVSYDEQAPVHYYRINGLNSIFITFYANENANQIVLAEKIEKEIEGLISGTEGLYLDKSYDATQFIRKELNKIYLRSLLTIAILLVFILIISRNLKYSIIVAWSIAVSFAVCLVVYYLVGLPLHLYSFAGLSISLGLMIDSIVIMVDHYRVKRDVTVFRALLASAATTLAALGAVFFIPGSGNNGLLDFAKIVSINIAVVLFVSTFLVPSILNLFPFSKTGKHHFSRKKRVFLLSRVYFRIFNLLFRGRKWIIALFILAFGIPVFLLPPKLEVSGLFSKVYNNTFGSDFYKENLKPYADTYLGGCLRLFMKYVYEGSYYTKPEETKLYIRASMPSEATITQLNEVFIQLENYLAGFPEIDKFITSIYSQQYGSITISFKPSHENDGFPYLLKNKLITKVIDMGGIAWDIYGVGKGFDIGGGGYRSPSLAIKLEGYNADILEDFAEYATVLLQTNPRVCDIKKLNTSSWWENTRNDSYFLTLDKYKLMYYNLNAGYLYNSTSCLNASPVYDMQAIKNGRLELINIYPAQSSAFDVWSLNNFAFSRDTNMFRFKNMARISKEKLSSVIYKENQNYIKMVQFTYNGVYKFANKHMEYVVSSIKDKLPLGFKVNSIEISFYSIDKEGAQPYFLIILIVVIAIFFVCAILFESLLQPFIIIVLLPISYIGVFLTFYFFDLNFDQGGYASFVLLAGITVNSTILIINDFNHLRKLKSLHRKRLFLKAFNQKIVPILLSVISTILGLLPFMIFGQKEPFWFALAVGTTGGLVFSLIGIYLILPLLIVSKDIT